VANSGCIVTGQITLNYIATSSTFTFGSGSFWAEPLTGITTEPPTGNNYYNHDNSNPPYHVCAQPGQVRSDISIFGAIPGGGGPHSLVAFKRWTCDDI
jgi:hypothetical protein